MALKYILHHNGTQFVQQGGLEHQAIPIALTAESQETEVEAPRTQCAWHRKTCFRPVQNASMVLLHSHLTKTCTGCRSVNSTVRAPLLAQVARPLKNARPTRTVSAPRMRAASVAAPSPDTRDPARSPKRRYASFAQGDGPPVAWAARRFQSVTGQPPCLTVHRSTGASRGAKAGSNNAGRMNPGWDGITGCRSCPPRLR